MQDAKGSSTSSLSSESIDGTGKLRIYLFPYRLWRHRNILLILLAALVFVALCSEKFAVFEDDAPASRSFALLALLIILWTTHALPIYVTSLLIPFLAVPLHVLVKSSALDDSDARMNVDLGEATLVPAPVAAKMIFRSMFVPIVPVLLAGFAMAAAVKKHAPLLSNRYAAAFVVGKEHLCSLLLLVMFLLLWVSIAMPNEAIAMLIFSLLQPLIHELTAEDALPRCRALLMGIAMAANVGGMMSPVSSPQNILTMALGEMFDIGNMGMEWKVSWWRWMAVSVPVGHVTVVLIWLMLVVAYGMHRPQKTKDIERGGVDDSTIPEPFEILQRMREARRNSVQSPSTSLASSSAQIPTASNENDNPLTPLPFKTKVSLAITTSTILLTIILWCLTTTGHLTPYLGNIGIASLPCLVILFSTGQLHLQDWLRLPWDVVTLAMGGSALTLVAQQSGLMPALASLLALKLSTFSLWTQHFLACTAMAVLASISSRFVAALVYLPILVSTAKVLAVSSGNDMGSGVIGGGVFMEMPFVLLCTLACSAGMALPISGLINYSFAQLHVTYPPVVNAPDNHARISPVPSSHPHNTATIVGSAVGKGGTVVKEFYLGWRDWAVIGVLSTFFATGAVVSVGYLMVYHVIV